MKPVDPAEVSAMLDGELPAERAEQVRRAIAKDLELARIFEELSGVHAEMTACAAVARFHPRISLSESSGFPTAHGLAIAAAVVLLRFAIKLVPASAGLVFEAALLAALVWWLATALTRLAEGDCRRHLGAAPVKTG